MDKFVKNARFLRLINGYSQQEIAGLLHVSRSTYLCLERGKKPLDLDQVYTLSSFYGVAPKSFISFDISQYILDLIAIGHKGVKPIPLDILRQNIKLLRTTKGLSQESVASLLHISRSTYSAYESGSKTPDVHMLVAIATLFEVDVDLLITHDLHKYHHEKV